MVLRWQRQDIVVGWRGVTVLGGGISICRMWWRLGGRVVGWSELCGFIVVAIDKVGVEKVC